MSSEKNNNYVDNKVLYPIVKDWLQKREKDQTLRLPELVGKAILDTANNLAKRWNFSGYTDIWKDLMIGDAIETCCKGFHNFDYVKYDNVHVYITKTCFRAMVARILIEKKHNAIKSAYYLENVHDFVDDDISEAVNPELYIDILSKVTSYDDVLEKKREKRRQKYLEAKGVSESGLSKYL